MDSALASTTSSHLQLSVTELFLGIQLLYLLSCYLPLKGFSKNWFPVSSAKFMQFWVAIAVLGFGILQVLGFEYLTLSMLLAAIIVISTLSPVLAISCFLSVFLMRPWELVVRQPETMTYIPKILAVVCLSSCLFHMMHRQSKKFIWNTPLILFCGLVLSLFASAILSGDMRSGLDYLVKHFYPIAVITFLVLNFVEDEQSKRVVCTTLALSVCGVVVTSFAETFLGEYNSTYEYRLHTSTFWGNPNDLAALILIAIPFVLFPIILRAKRLEQFFLGSTMLSILILGLLATQSRGALLGLFIAGFIYLLTGSRKRLVLACCSALFVIGAAIFIMAAREAEDRDTSDISRITYAIAGFNMLKARPIFGVGIGNYPEQYNNYSPEFYEWGQRNAHSSWVLIMAEAGLVGSIIFFLLFASTWKRAWALRQSKPEYLASLVGYGTAMSLLAHTYTFPPYLLMALIVTANRFTNVEQQKQRESDRASIMQSNQMLLS